MNYYLVFYSDNGNREDCNVYYSNLVIADDEDDAIDKYISSCRHKPDRDRLEALEMKPIK